MHINSYKYNIINIINLIKISKIILHYEILCILGLCKDRKAYRTQTLSIKQRRREISSYLRRIYSIRKRFIIRLKNHQNREYLVAFRAKLLIKYGIPFVSIYCCFKYKIVINHLLLYIFINMTICTVRPYIITSIMYKEYYVYLLDMCSCLVYIS